MSNIFQYIWQGVRSNIHMSPGNEWKWKCQNGVGKSEIDLFWCISMTNYVISKSQNQWKGLNFQIQCFYNGRSLTDRSSLLKTRKTRETKTWITQNFELVWPIQGRTMWKLTSWGFRKCGSFQDLEVLNQSYWLSKSSQISKLRAWFFFTAPFPLNFFFKFDQTLTSHNYGLKHRNLENYHIFGILRTSAFRWYHPR